MTKRQHKALQSYFNSLLPKLGLSDWSVDLYDEPLEEDDEALAEIYKEWGRKQAHVLVRGDFFESPPEYQRHICVHELLHAVHAQSEALVFERLSEWMPKAGFSVFETAFRQAHEYAVDGLAVAIAPLFPLPELP